MGTLIERVLQDGGSDPALVVLLALVLAGLTLVVVAVLAAIFAGIAGAVTSLREGG